MPRLVFIEAALRPDWLERLTFEDWKLLVNLDISRGFHNQDNLVQAPELDRLLTTYYQQGDKLELFPEATAEYVATLDLKQKFKLLKELVNEISSPENNRKVIDHLHLFEKVEDVEVFRKGAPEWPMYPVDGQLVFNASFFLTPFYQVWIAPDGVAFDVAASHSMWIDNNWDKWGTYEGASELGDQVNAIVKEHGDDAIALGLTEKPFIAAGWVRVCGDALQGRADRLPVMKAFVKNNGILREDREQKIMVYLGNEYFHGSVMEFMRWDGTNEVKAALTPDDEGASRFWIDPKGKLLSTEGLLHEDWLLKKGLVKKIKSRGFQQDAEDFVAAGWVRVVHSNEGVLYVKTRSTDMIAPALKKLASQQPETLFVRKLIVDDGTEDYEDNEINVLKGEDAEDAWKHRKDVRHRVKAAVKAQAWLLSPKGVFHAWSMDYEKDEGKHHGEFLATPAAKRIWGKEVADVLDDVDFENDMPSDIAQVALDKGWDRGALSADGNVYVDAGSRRSPEAVLAAIPPQFLLGKVVTNGQDEVPILEGEDALDAWKRRKDVRHRVRASKTYVGYHGTNAAFTDFDSEKRELGFHFGSSIEQAKNRGSRIIKARLTLNHPVDWLLDLGNWGDLEMLREYFSQERDPDYLFTKEEFDAFNTAADVREALQAKGYDGVIYENQFEGVGQSYLVFEPGQIEILDANLKAARKSEKDVKFSILPNGRYFEFLSARNIEDLTDHDSFMDDLEEAGKVTEDDYEKTPQHEAGYTRGGIDEARNLWLDTNKKNDIAWILSKIPQERRFADFILVHDQHIPILEGEDALDAWKHRKDVRHRVKAAIALVEENLFFLSPNGKLKTYSSDSEHSENVDEATDGEFDSVSDAEVAGWTTGRFVPGEQLVFYSPGESSETAPVLDILSRLPYEYLLVPRLVVGFPSDPGVEVPVLPGEDALDAWKHRKDVRHRVKARKADLASMGLTISHTEYNTKDGWSKEQAGNFGEDGVPAHRITITDQSGEEVARVGLGVYTGYSGRKILECLNGDGGAELFVDEKYQRQGLASEMYDYAEKITGLEVYPSHSLTEQGQSFWKGRHDSRHRVKAAKGQRSIPGPETEQQKFWITPSGEVLPLKRHTHHDTLLVERFPEQFPSQIESTDKAVKEGWRRGGVTADGMLWFHMNSLDKGDIERAVGKLPAEWLTSVNTVLVEGPDLAMKQFEVWEGETIQEALAVRGSMIDYPKETLPPDVFSKDEMEGYHILPEVAENIRKTVADTLEALFIHPQRWVTRLLLGSSIATQFYNADTDIDVKIEVDADSFRESNPEYKDFTSEQLTTFWDELMEPLDRDIGYGTHPYELRIRDKEHFQDPKYLQNFDALYDITNDTWDKTALLVDPKTYKRQKTVNPGMRSALQVATSWDGYLGEIRRNLSELELIQEAEGDLLGKDEKYAQGLLAIVEKDITTLVKMKKEIKQGRSDAYAQGKGELDYINSHPDIIKMKLLVRWGYFDIIKRLGHILKERGNLVMSDVPNLSQAVTPRVLARLMAANNAGKDDLINAIPGASRLVFAEDASSKAQAWIDKVYAMDKWGPSPDRRSDVSYTFKDEKGEDVAFTAFRLKPNPMKKDTVEIEWLMAYPQRQGYGSKIINELKELAAEDGITLTLMPWANGTVSQTSLTRLYKRLGFKPERKGDKAMRWEPQVTAGITAGIYDEDRLDEKKTVLDYGGGSLPLYKLDENAIPGTVYWGVSKGTEDVETLATFKSADSAIAFFRKTPGAASIDKWEIGEDKLPIVIQEYSSPEDVPQDELRSTSRTPLTVEQLLNMKPRAALTFGGTTAGVMDIHAASRTGYDGVCYHGTSIGEGGNLFSDVGGWGEEYYVSSQEEAAEFYTSWKDPHPRGHQVVYRGKLHLGAPMFVDAFQETVDYGGEEQDFKEFMAELTGGEVNDEHVNNILDYQQDITTFASDAGCDGVVFVRGFSQSGGADIAVFDPKSFEEGAVKILISGEPENGEWTPYMSIDEANKFLEGRKSIWAAQGIAAGKKRLSDLSPEEKAKITEAPETFEGNYDLCEFWDGFAVYCVGPTASGSYRVGFNDKVYWYRQQSDGTYVRYPRPGKVRAGKIDELLKLARLAVQDDPRWEGYQENPALATQLGEVQQLVDEARSKDDLQRFWEQYALTPSLEELEKKAEEVPAKGKAKEESPKAPEKIE